MALSIRQTPASEDSQLFDKHTCEHIFSTIDFFLNLDQRTVDKIWEKLLVGYAIWAHERKSTPVEKTFKTRKPLLEIPDDLKKKPWDYDDYRANSPIKLLNHLWSIGYFREPYLIYSLKAFAILISIKENNPAWREQILQESFLLKSFEIEIYKTGNQNFKEAKSRQCKGLNRHKTSQSFMANALKDAIHTRATELLELGKPKSNIASLITKTGIQNIEGTKNLDVRQIRRYLEDHKSGLWKPKKQKKLTSR